MSSRAKIEEIDDAVADDTAATPADGTADEAVDGASGGTQGSSDLLRNVISDDDAAAAATVKEPEDGFVDILGSGDLLRKVTSEGKGRDTRPEDGEEVEIDLHVTIDGVASPADCGLVTLVLGDNDLGYGLDLILKLMELNEVCKVKTTARYDDRELPRPDARIEYEIRLVGVADPVLTQDMSEAQRLAAGLKKKARGNDLYSRQHFDLAAQAFNRGLRYLSDGMFVGLINKHPSSYLALSRFSHTKMAASEASTEITELKVVCLNNLAAVQIKMAAFDLAIGSCDRALSINPSSAKALYRKAQGLQGKKDFDGASECLSVLLQAEPDNTSARRLLATVQKGRAQEKAVQKAMTLRMFSALDGSSPDVVAREKEIAEQAAKAEALAAAKAGPKMSDWELRLWVTLAVLVVSVSLTMLWPFYSSMLRAAFDRFDSKAN